jgi:hypothetical protein
VEESGDSGPQHEATFPSHCLVDRRQAGTHRGDDVLEARQIRVLPVLTGRMRLGRLQGQNRMFAACITEYVHPKNFSKRERPAFWARRSRTYRRHCYSVQSQCNEGQCPSASPAALPAGFPEQTPTPCICARGREAGPPVKLTAFCSVHFMDEGNLNCKSDCFT